MTVGCVFDSSGLYSTMAGRGAAFASALPSLTAACDS